MTQHAFGHSFIQTRMHRHRALGRNNLSVLGKPQSLFFRNIPRRLLDKFMIYIRPPLQCGTQITHSASSPKLFRMEATQRVMRTAALHILLFALNACTKPISYRVRRLQSDLLLLLKKSRLG